MLKKKTHSMKKTFLLLLLAFTSTAAIGQADSTYQWTSARSPSRTNVNSTLAAPAMPQGASVAGSPVLTDATSAFGADLNSAAGAGFAQVNNGGKPLPLLSMWFFPLLALGVLGLRIHGVHRARTLADQEYETNLARAKVYQSLHARD